MNNQSKNISYGIIVYKLINNEPYYCLICRKDSFTYSDFIRGKYQLEDVESIYRMITYMTETEKEIIASSDFNTLWGKLWTLNENRTLSHSFIKECNQSKYKFDTLKKGYYTVVHLDLGKREKQLIKLENILNNVEKKGFIEPEWGFPKGKKNKNESPIECAKREFFEETNISIRDEQLDTSIQYEEKFIGDNLILYSHIYYLAKCSPDTLLEYDSNNIHQFTEISKIQWLTYDDCINKIRPYSIEKLNVLKEVHNTLIKNK